MEELHVHLLAGIFVNFACAMNFFVYFVTSKEYRQVFNEYIFFCPVNTSDARSSRTGEKTAERTTALRSTISTVTARHERFKEYRQVFNEYIFFCAANTSSDARSSRTGEKNAERTTALPSFGSTVTARNERL
ncbi:hypothetical protein OESDEN_04920 [Oesophagostomum dentatum]|uniref:Uncharacterized protein n=1 Tax=Oesophagostomum dentatum TaxID=61180 RepID=A0A0B1TGF5_OESDE|nr:hypothetical protein OESDEN_04920 [Oesophagostomum dentatum]